MPECRIVEGSAETIVNCDMWLYLDFQVEDEWRTVGCKGLERFNYTMWSKRFILPTENLQLRNFDDKSLCIVAAENPESGDESQVQVILGKCGDSPTTLEQWSYSEASGKISLVDEDVDDWNLCTVTGDLSEDLSDFVKQGGVGCEWYYDQFLGIIQSKDNHDWCIGYTQGDVATGNPLVIKPCVGNENSTKFGDWWENPDRVAEIGCPFQETAEPAGSDPMHAVVEEFAEFQNVWIAEFVAVLEKVLANGYENGELVDGPDMTGMKCLLPNEEDNGDWICKYI